MSRVVTPEVRAASNDILLLTFAALTHRLHEADRDKREGAIIRALEIRAQRNEVQEEILRRMGVAEDVITLWNRLDGWIPGGAYAELASVLHVDPDRLLEVRRNRKPAPEAPGSY